MSSQPTQPVDQPRSRAWPHVRAALVLLHLAAVLLLSLPSSPRLQSRHHWSLPQQQADLEKWSATLGVTKDGLESFLWDWTQRYVGVRKWVTRPFLVYADYTGTRQGWTMFSNPRRRTGRFEIAVEVDGEFEVVYRTKDDGAEWNRWQFEHNRMRKLLALLTTHPQEPAFDDFTRWIARQLAVDFPNASRGKITLYTWTLLGPSAVRDGKKPTVAPSRNQQFSLEALR